MKTIYIVRHAESQENKNRIFTIGKAPLTDEGKSKPKNWRKDLKTWRLI